MSDPYHDRLSTSSSGEPSRRDFLKTGTLSTLALGTGGMASSANGQSRTDVSDINLHGEARNVIFLVSDGMSVGTLRMATSCFVATSIGPRTGSASTRRGAAGGVSTRPLPESLSPVSQIWGSTKMCMTWDPDHRPIMTRKVIESSVPLATVVPVTFGDE